MQVNYSALVLSFVAVEDAQSEYVGKLTTFANGTAQVFVPGMKFDAYMSASKAWRDAYSETKKASAEAAQAAFERMLVKMNEFLRAKDAEPFVIPKSEAKDAVRKANASKAAKEASAKALASIGIRPDMTSAEASVALSKAKKASDETRTAALAFIAERSKEETKAKAKALDIERRAIADAIRDYLKTAPIERVREEAKRLGVALPSVK